MSDEERPLAVGPIQDPKIGPRVAIVLANGTAIAFRPDQARMLAMRIRAAANEAELGKHAGSIADVIAFMQPDTDAPPRH